MSKSLVDRIVSRAERRRASHAAVGGVDYWPISARAASQLVREAYGTTKRLPRPGYQMDLPPSERNGHPGRWVISNYAGKYEIQFYYRSGY